MPHEMNGSPVSGLPISGHTALYAIFGSPVAHSLSPAMYNLCFEHYGLDARYLAFDVGASDMARALDAMRLFRLRGANVTMPGKQAAARLVDERSLVVEITGACNTIVNRDGYLTGHCTDGAGLIAALRAGGIDIRGRRIALLGAGGAAAAIMVQCATDGAAQVDVLNRRSARYKAAGRMIERLSERQGTRSVALHDWADQTALRSCIAAADILINATSVGMAPASDAVPLPPACRLGHLTALVDIIYNPAETALMRMARHQGVPTVLNGYGMLLYQGAAAFRLFTGLDMPVSRVAETVFGLDPGPPL